MTEIVNLRWNVSNDSRKIFSIALTVCWLEKSYEIEWVLYRNPNSREQVSV